MLNASYIAYKERNIDYFAEKLNDNELYRLAISFPNDILFLDIETTGLSHYYDCITVIGWSLNNKYKYYIQGISNPEDFINDIQNSKIIVTFNGKIFDIPFIKKLFPNLVFPKCHIDLRFFSKTCGLGGSQKRIEKNINFNRPKALQNTDGYTATILWDKYKWGNRSSLKKLISYNFYDIEGMKFILDFCINHIYKQKQCKRFECPAKFYDKNIKLDKKNLIDTIKNSTAHVDLKSKLKYKNLYDKIGRNIKIVGIDLTGDKKRASGFCFMSNNQIKTMRVSTDEEIIQLIINFQPHIVSIDSPLSLPYGRISVFDDDPGRDKFGILRKCERILKKRGINSYPTLLPSMQKLTKRGIDITNKLRNLGFPVIESYPGAAQDIMGLPRKQAGLKYLKKGLGVFGLKGKFSKTDISHDELDAITAAIVGLFF